MSHFNALPMDGSHYFPFYRNEKYPKPLGTDFRLLKRSTLKKYIRFFHINTRPDCTHTEDAVAVARHFDSVLESDEVDTLSKFMSVLNRNVAPPEGITSKRTTTRRNRTGDGKESGKRKSSKTSKNDKNSVEEDGPEIYENDDDDRPYCICNRPSFGDMICCDNSKCEVQWFHMPCVGMTPQESREAKWYCPMCRASSSDDEHMKPKKNTKKDRKRSKGANKKSNKRSRVG